MSRKREKYLYTKEVKGPKRDTSSEIDRFALERYVESQIQEEIDVDKILSSREFTVDELRLVKLIIAKHIFLTGNKKVAEKLLKEVEQSPDKGTDVFFYLEQIKKNKTLYAEKARHNPSEKKVKPKVYEKK